ncbi:MAG TPA: hypothetical protein VGD24_06775 [Gallionella sp.]
MKQKKIFTLTLAAVMAGPVWASAATQPAAPADFQWYAKTGLGYDSNAFKAPSSSYIDLAAGNAVVNPSAKSGFFVPYEVGAEVAKKSAQNVTLTGSAALDGSQYIGSGVTSASQYSVNLNGGAELVFARDGKAKNSLYGGAIIEKHNQVYVDHDSGADKTTAGGADISARYNYTSLGGEAKYRHGTGRIDYGFSGKLLMNDYDNPAGVNPLDHTYITIGADASMPVFAQASLSLNFDHSVRDYTNRHARDANGTLANANPLLVYTYDALGATLRKRFSTEWLAYFDVDLSQRADNFVGYNDYTQNRIGGRVLFEQGSIKGRVALHHWSRDYPNGFAFDRPAGGSKTYSGNDLKVSAELAQGKNSAFWAELVYDSQTSTDLRYDYVRTVLMGGMNWKY